MSPITRRTAGALAGASALSALLLAKAAAMTQTPPGWMRHDEIALLVYPKMTALDLIGPQHMFAALMGARVHLVGKTLDPVTSDTGVTIAPTATFETCPRDLTVLFAGGGTVGTLAAMSDDRTLDFLADRGARAAYVTSVCTGSLLLGAAGLLDGYRATSHWAAKEVLPEFGAIPTEGRVVRDRNRITGGGVTAGLDFGLAMIAELRDATYAQGVQLQSEYDPHPPFSAGSPGTAPAEVLELVRPMSAGFVRHAHEMARRRRRAPPA